MVAQANREPLELKNVLSKAAQRGAALGPDQGKMCKDCAFRSGSDANNDEDAVEAAMQCLAGCATFNCHTKEFEDAGCRCAGFLYAAQYMASSEFSTEVMSNYKNGMGLHISIYKLGTERDEEGYLIEETRVSKEYSGFDSARMVGDSDFATSGLFDRVPDRDHHPETFYHRPADFNKAREWVKANISFGNQRRLLDVLNVMERDPKLHFSFVW